MGIFDIFARARANKPLTPGERALLKIVDGLGMTFLAAALPIVWTAFTAWTAGSALQMSWSLVIDNAVKAGAIAVGFAFLHYVRAIQDSANGVGPNGSTPVSNDSVEWLLDQVEALASKDFGVPQSTVNQILGAVEGMLNEKLTTAANTQPVPVVKAATDAVAQLDAFQAFQLPAGHVPVMAPNGVYVVAPADAVAPSLQSSSVAVSDAVAQAAGLNAAVVPVEEQPTVASPAIAVEQPAADASGPEVLDPSNAVVTLAPSPTPDAEAQVDTASSAQVPPVADDNSSPVSA